MVKVPKLEEYLEQKEHIDMLVKEAIITFKKLDKILTELNDIFGEEIFTYELIRPETLKTTENSN